MFKRAMFPEGSPGMFPPHPPPARLGFEAGPHFLHLEFQAGAICARLEFEAGANCARLEFEAEQIWARLESEAAGGGGSAKQTYQGTPSPGGFPEGSPGMCVSHSARSPPGRLEFQAGAMCV